MGLGPGAHEALTIGALKELKTIKIYILEQKNILQWFLKDEGIKFESYDHAYENMIALMIYKYNTEDLITKIKDDEDLIYAVPGQHPLVAENQ